MRLRNKNWTIPFLKEKGKYLIDSETKVDTVFSNNNKIELEIGCGKGNFITSLSIIEPETNFIALEKERTVVGVALRHTLETYKKIGTSVKNLKYANAYIEKFNSQIPDNSISKIYLNFSDPWPKARHKKNRLTSRNHLNIYYRILKENGEIHIKTDNENLYKFTLAESVFANFSIILNENDLYSNKELLKDNIASEYEKKFHEMGMKIKKIILLRKNKEKTEV